MRSRVGITKEIRKPLVEYDHPGTVNDEPSMTKQSFAEELDANNIIKRTGGNIEAAIKFEGIWGEFNEYDLKDAMQKVQDANDLFLEVPSELRKAFDNDAGKYIDFVTDPANLKTLEEFGLATALEQQVQDHEPPAPEPAPEPEPAP